MHAEQAVTVGESSMEKQKSIVFDYMQTANTGTAENGNAGV